MISHARFHTIFRASAIYDIALSLPFATAPTMTALWWVLDQLSLSLGLGSMPILEPHTVMFANFFGTVVTIWGLIRLKFNMPYLARWDAAGRVLFSLAMIVALKNGINPIVWPALVLEIIWAVLQLLPVNGRTWSDLQPTELAAEIKRG